MDEESNVLPDTPEQDEVTTTEETVVEESQSDDSKNKQLYARLKKEEAARKAAEAELQQLRTQSTNPPEPRIDDERFARLELKTDGYTSDEVDFIMNSGGRDALKNEYVQAAIKSMRDKKKSEDATPGSSPKSPVYKRHTRDELMAMPTEELEKLLRK